MSILKSNTLGYLFLILTLKLEYIFHLFVTSCTGFWFQFYLYCALAVSCFYVDDFISFRLKEVNQISCLKTKVDILL